MLQSIVQTASHHANLYNNSLLPLVSTVCMLPCLVEWQITLIVIGALALVVGIVISITVMMVSWHRIGELSTQVALRLFT